MDKKSRKSATKWSQASERVLIDLWKDKITELRGCRKNTHIIAEMMAEMEKQGFSYRMEELKTKMHNLTVRYRKEKQAIGVSGGSPSEWDLYADMHLILGPFKSFNSENLVLDSIKDINSDISGTMSSSPCAPPPLSPPSLPVTSAPMSPDISPPQLAMDAPSSSKKTKKESLFNVLNKVEESIANMQGEMQKTSQKILQIEEEKKDILKGYVDREAEVQKALIEFLKKSELAFLTELSMPFPIRLNRAFK